LHFLLLVRRQSIVQPVEAAITEAIIDHRYRVLAHLTGADRVKDSKAALPRILQSLVIEREVQ